MGIKERIGWRGVMDGRAEVQRQAALAVLVVVAWTLVATQVGFLAVAGTYLALVLAPVAAAALLLGPRDAALVGLAAGLALVGHAAVLPLDAIERTMAVPVALVCALPLAGALVGTVLAGSTVGSAPFRVRTLGLPCTVAAVAFEATLVAVTLAATAVGGRALDPQVAASLGAWQPLVAQVLTSVVVMGVAAAAARTIDGRRRVGGQDRTLLETFQGWLAIVVVVAYLLVIAGGFLLVTFAAQLEAHQALDNQIGYLSGQVESHDLLIASLAQRLRLTDEGAHEIHQGTIRAVARGLRLWETGMSVVGENGVVVSSSDPALVGEGFDEIVARGLGGESVEALFDQVEPRVWYPEARTGDAALLRVARSGDYQMLVALPMAEVFEFRGWTMALLSVVCALLFAAVYAQASLLLKNVVVRGIDETNDTLNRITEGDLSQEVEVHDSAEFTSLSAGINATVSALKDAIAAEGARIEGDLATAKAIQESALPRTFPPFPDIEAFDIFASMNAAREVGGDFYDFFLIDDHTLGFLIADVSGKGIPASLFMMAAKAELANYMASGMELAEAVATANWHLCQGNDTDMFVTAWVATLDWRSGALTFVNAGHNFPLLRHEGRWDWVRGKGGMVLGAFDESRYRTGTLTLVAGDELLLYTDGVSEAYSADLEVFGNDRLERFLAAHNDAHPSALVNGLRRELAAWSGGCEQSDDITMLALEFGVAPEARGEVTVPAALTSFELVASFVHDELEGRRCPIRVQNRIDVALEELFVMVCEHARAEEGAQAMARVGYAYSTDPNAITISIAGAGEPFDPLAAGPDSLGTALVRGMADDLTYVRDGDLNVITFRAGW